MIIWGWRTSVKHLATVVFMCRQSGQPAAHHVLKRVTKFTLFFIPLFPINIKYVLDCSLCGESSKIDKEQAEAMIAQEQSRGGHGAPPAPPQSGGGYGPPQQPYGGPPSHGGHPAPQQPAYPAPQQPPAAQPHR